MLSIRFGYGLPAFLARAFAAAFCEAVSGVDLRFGFGLSQTFFVVAIVVPLGFPSSFELWSQDLLLVFRLPASAGVVLFSPLPYPPPPSLHTTWLIMLRPQQVTK